MVGPDPEPAPGGAPAPPLKQSLISINPKQNCINVIFKRIITSSFGHSSHSAHVGHASWCTSSCLVHLGDDGVANALHLLLFVLELLNLRQLVGVQPLDSLVTLVNLTNHNFDNMPVWLYFYQYLSPLSN